LDKGLSKNADGSVDIYFGPKVPASQESNWIYTQTEKSWFPWFRFYGPEKALFDKSWTMPDIEMVKQQRFWAPRLVGRVLGRIQTNGNFAHRLEATSGGAMSKTQIGDARKVHRAI
jgi:hypothetical protein